MPNSFATPGYRNFQNEFEPVSLKAGDVFADDKISVEGHINNLYSEITSGIADLKEFVKLKGIPGEYVQIAAAATPTNDFQFNDLVVFIKERLQNRWFDGNVIVRITGQITSPVDIGDIEMTGGAILSIYFQHTAAAHTANVTIRRISGQVNIQGQGSFAQPTIFSVVRCQDVLLSSSGNTTIYFNNLSLIASPRVVINSGANQSVVATSLVVEEGTGAFLRIGYISVTALTINGRIVVDNQVQGFAPPSVVRHGIITDNRAGSPLQNYANVGDIGSLQNAIATETTDRQQAVSALETLINTLSGDFANLSYLKSVAHDTATGTVTFTRQDNTTLQVHIPGIVAGAVLDPSTNELVITFQGGAEIRVDLAALIPIYKGATGANIQISINQNNEIAATLIAGSITAADVGAAAADHTHTAAQIGAEPVRTTATQAEAEAGTSSTVRRWTALRIRQAINAVTGAIQTALNALTAAFNTHADNRSNPHGVTAQQTGAAAANHTHTAAQVGAATANHVHAPLEVGAGFGTVATAAATNAKVGTMPGFVRNVGSMIALQWNITPTAMTTLNVNATGAANVFFGNVQINTANGNLAMLQGGHVFLFVWTGSRWQLLNPRPLFSGNALQI